MKLKPVIAAAITTLVVIGASVQARQPYGNNNGQNNDSLQALYKSKILGYDQTLDARKEFAEQQAKDMAYIKKVTTPENIRREQERRSQGGRIWQQQQRQTQPWLNNNNNNTQNNNSNNSNNGNDNGNGNGNQQNQEPWQAQRNPWAAPPPPPPPPSQNYDNTREDIFGPDAASNIFNNNNNNTNQQNNQQNNQNNGKKPVNIFKY